MHTVTRSLPQPSRIGNGNSNDTPGFARSCRAAPSADRPARDELKDCEVQYARSVGTSPTSGADERGREQFRTKFQIGESFNPYGMFRGALVPAPILRNPNISPSEKLIVARLIQYAGDNGRAWPRIETLASEIGLGARQVQKCLKNLEDTKLINRLETQGGRHKSSVFVFLWSHVYEEKTPNNSSPFLSSKGEREFGVSAPKGEPEFVVSSQNGEREFGVSTPERVNSSSRKGELSCSERVNDRSPRINPVEVIHESERASGTEEPPPAVADVSTTRELSALADTQTREPQEEQRKPTILSFTELEPVLGALDRCGIKVRERRIAEELIQLAASRQVGIPGLVAFIQHKATVRRVEIATFFRRAIPEDLRPWAARNGWLEVPMSNPSCLPEIQASEIPLACSLCDDSGVLSGTFQTGDSSNVIRPCECSAGERVRERYALVYSVASSACPVCLSTLSVQPKDTTELISHSSCAFCYHPTSLDGAERPESACRRLGAAGPADRCETCEWDPVAARNTGLIKSSWGTEQSEVAYCGCQWGEYARKTSGPGYLERITRTERNIALRERQWIERGTGVRSRQSAVPKVATPVPAPQARDGNKTTCPECRMQVGSGFKVSATGDMEPCTCTSPALAAEIRQAVERSREHRRADATSGLQRISVGSETTRSRAVERALA